MPEEEQLDLFYNAGDEIERILYQCFIRGNHHEDGICIFPTKEEGLESEESRAQRS